jgi:hypothetical protein
MSVISAVFIFLDVINGPVSLLDLDHFKLHTRSAVSVREGQGVVLLCGTPTSSGGIELLLLSSFDT